jgi:anti-anti-sigma factor
VYSYGGFRSGRRDPEGGDRQDMDNSKVLFACIVEGGCVRVSGEIDINTAPTFQKALLECARDSGRMPVVDMTGVTYFDSSGIQALIEASKSGPEEEGKISILGAGPNVLRIMHLVGLADMFDVGSEG